MTKKTVLKTQPIPEKTESKDYSDDEGTAESLAVPTDSIPDLPRKKRPPPSAATISAMKAGLAKMREKGLVARKQKAEERHVASLSSKGYKIEKPATKEDEILAGYKAKIAELEARLTPGPVSAIETPAVVKVKRVYKPRKPKANTEPAVVERVGVEQPVQPQRVGKFDYLKNSIFQ